MGPPMYHLLDNVISETVGLVYTLTCSPNRSFLDRLVSDNSGSLDKLELEHHPPQPHLRKNFLHGVRVLVHGYQRIRFDLHSFINNERYKRFLQIGGQ